MTEDSGVETAHDPRTAPRISVLLPCRDAATTLDEALDSLERQTFADFEIVAVDDGSADGTAAVLVARAAREARLRVVRTERLGIVSALNAAATRAQGTVLARMDADDVCEPTRFARQLAYLDDHPHLAACGTRIRYLPRRLLRDGARRYERWVNEVVTNEQMIRDLFVECPIPHPTLMIRRDAFADAGGYREAPWPEDYDLLLRLWQAGHAFGKVPQVLLDWRERPGRLSRTDRRYAADAFRRCKAHYLRHRIAGRGVVVCGAGPLGKAFARALVREGVRLLAFIDIDRRKVGCVVHGVPVVERGDAATYPNAYMVAAVGAPGAREDIRAWWRAHGRREPDDACAVA